jgi:hypothetical protein
MFFFRKHCRFLASPLAALMLVVSLPLGTAQAALVSTDQVVQDGGMQSDRERITALIMREDVQRQLRVQGVDPEEATARIATLSDAEVSRMAARIDSMPAGQGVVESVVGALLIVFIILLILDLAGVTDVFSFDR